MTAIGRRTKNQSEEFKSLKPSGNTTSILLPTTSILLQISSANGINNSSPRTSTTRIGVPACSSPIACTSTTFPISDGASFIKQGEDATIVAPATSNTEHPTKSSTKYCPAGNTTRCSNGINTSNPRNLSASEIEAHPSNQYTACPA